MTLTCTVLTLGLRPSWAPHPAWRRSGSSVCCKFDYYAGVHTSTKRPVLVGARAARRGVPSHPPSCRPRVSSCLRPH
jgi:hypothetical protein